MPLDIDPRVDFAFKRLFGVESNKELLIDLLNAGRHPSADERIIEVELLDPFNLRDFQGDKLSIVDLRARDQRERWLQVEMRMIAHQELVRRLVFNGARTYAGQLKDWQDYATAADDRHRLPVRAAVSAGPRLSPDVSASGWGTRNPVHRRLGISYD
ncbi:MAG: PD-(D/E)XK nuclease family transposase [Planctomycetaceae bacterium]|nr:PD-(D/E)XK nuclease family transposase [Planctomycetaceae bacterium]